MRVRENIVQISSFIICAIVFLMFPLVVDASSELNFKVDSVKIGEKTAILKQHEKDSDVYIASITDRSIGEGYTISLTTDSEATVSATDFEGALKVEQNDGKVEITKPILDDYTINGAYVCHVSVQKENQTEEYDIVLSGSSAWNNITETYIADTTSDELNYLDTETTTIQGNSSTVPSYKDITVGNTVKQVSLIRWTGKEKNTSYSITDMGWLSSGFNYVRINSKNNENFKRFQASSNYQSTFVSPQLTLEKGLNVIEIYSIDKKIAALDKDEGNLKEGLSEYSIEGYDCAVYLVYTDGEKQEKVKGTDTSLSYLEATQLGSSSVSMTSYGTKQEEKQWTIVVPKEMPLNKIILGIAPNDPDADFEITNKDIIKGSRVGMYTAVDIGSSLSSIPVKVTAADGKTTESYNINILRAAGDCELLKVTVDNGDLKSYDEKESIEFSSDKTMYLLQKKDENETKLKVDAISPEATCTINKKDSKEVTVDISDYLATITVMAEDGVHEKSYYFIYQDAEGNIPMLGSPDDEQIAKAKEILKPWYDRSDEARKNMLKNAYWAVFESAATGVDMNGGYVFNPEEDNYTQATVWSRAILQTVILGYNPYDFGDDHLNLVKGLLSLKNEYGLFGGYANNEWALMALKACGEEIPQGLIDYVKNTDMYNSWSIDMRGWALAALKGLIPEDELMEGVLALKDAQDEKTGLWGNVYTNGCVLSGIVGAGVDLDFFNKGEEKILDIIGKNSAVFDSKGEDIKDIIVGLGDVIEGSNVWQRYTLDSEKWDKLIKRAEELEKENAGNEALKTALASAKDNKNTAGNGISYFALYDEVAKIDKTWQIDISFGIPKEDSLIEPVEGTHYKINFVQNTSVAEADRHGWLKLLSVMNIKAGNKFGTICKLDSPDNVDYNQYTYKYMKKTLKGNCAVTTSTYQDKIYFLMLIENNEVIDARNEDTKIANSTIGSYGPVKVDPTAPELFVGANQDTLKKESNVIIKSDLKELSVKATDDMSGIWKIEYQEKDGDWISVYDAEKDDAIDIENDCGKLEKSLSIPVPESESFKVRVRDIAGLQAESMITKAPAFIEEPTAEVDKDDTFDLVWKLELNGSDLAAVMNGDTELTADTDYTVDSEAKTLTMKKDYLSTLEIGDYLITLKFTRDGSALETDLETVIKVGSSIETLKAMVEALGDVTLDKEEAVNAAKQFYDNLSQTVKDKVSDDIKQTLENAVAKLKELQKAKADQEAADQVTKLIEAIGTVDQTKEEEIQKAREAYNALTEDQKAFVAAETVKILETAEKAITDLKATEKSNQEAVEKVTNLIHAIGTVDSSKATAIEEARKAYDTLTEEQKKMIPADVIRTLEEAETKLKDIQSIVKVTGITLNKTSLSLLKGATAQLKVTVAPSDAANKSVTFTSSNTKVAVVSSDGLVTARQEGTAIITVTSVDGNKTATCKVKVIEKLNVKASKQTTSSIALKWSKITGAKGYQIYRYDSKKKKYISIATVKSNKNSYTIKRLNGKKGNKLAAGTIYRFQIRSYITVNGKKVYKKSEIVTTATKPKKTVITKVIKVSSTKAKITWKKVKGCSGYQVWMKNGKNGKYKLIKTISNPKTVKYTKAKLKKGQTYYFKVRAYKKVKQVKIYGAASSRKSVKMK